MNILLVLLAVCAISLAVIAVGVVVEFIMTIRVWIKESNSHE